MPRKYRNSVYTEFSNFSGHAVQRADDTCQTFNFANKMGNALGVIAAVLLMPLNVGWFIFTALCTLLAAGSIVFFMSISGFIVANPALAGVLIGVCGVGFTVTLWKSRDSLIRIQAVIKSYEEDFKGCQPGLDNTWEVEELMDRLVKDIIICAEKKWGFLLLQS